MPSPLFRRAIAAWLTLAGVPAVAFGQQATIAQDVINGLGATCNELGASYYGTATGSCGAVYDGGSDAFDTYGRLTAVPGGLLASRRTEAFASRSLYRFVDTFSNFTGAAITGQVTFFGDLGSDGQGRAVGTGSFYRVSSDAQAGSFGSDAVVAFVYGNNAFAQDYMAFAGTQATHTLTTTITVLPGQSVSLLSFAFLARSLTRNPTTQAADEALALAAAQGLVADPFLDGLSADERARIANFGPGVAAPSPLVTPEPGTWALLTTGLAGLAGVARRRRTA
jgi:hypothetical protein